MKIKFNWGFWIVVSFIVFAVGTFTMVYISMSTSVDLVTDDYYEKELKYQNHIELVKSTNALEQKVTMEFSEGSLVIKYPKIGKHDAYSGTIYFFRPSDKQGDFQKEISMDTSYTQSFLTDQFTKGLWRAKIFWNVSGQEYYSELPMIIQ
ncbi:MAG: FixH family protein [Bacteroidota bacterium]